MSDQINEKSKVLIALASIAGAALLAGCGPREETIVVTPPPTIEKTTIEKVPNDKPKTIIVKPAPKPAPKTKTETNVTVNVKPSPKPAPESTLPEPAPARDTTKVKIAPSSTPTAKPAQTKPTETSKPKPEAKPMATKPSQTKPASSSALKVRAEVIGTSKVPDPKSVPYKDALVFTKYKILEVKNGEYKEKEILVAQWGMKNKKLQSAARQKVGEVQTLTLQPLSQRGDLESVMRNDDTGEYDLEPYFAE